MIPAAWLDRWILPQPRWTGPPRGSTATIISAPRMTDYAIDAEPDALPSLPSCTAATASSPTADAGFSYYYSRTRMALTGTLHDHGAPLSRHRRRRGWITSGATSSRSPAPAGTGTASSSTNNTEFMLYVIRDAQKRPIATFGTFVPASGDPVDSAGRDRHAIAPARGPVPSRTASIHLDGTSRSHRRQLQPRSHVRCWLDQELVTAQSTGVAYWEGAVAISGSVSGAPISGQGYVELTGYAQPSHASPCRGATRCLSHPPTAVGIALRTWWPMKPTIAPWPMCDTIVRVVEWPESQISGSHVRNSA